MNGWFEDFTLEFNSLIRWHVLSVGSFVFATDNGSGFEQTTTLNSQTAAPDGQLAVSTP
jgi:hypothetical protein